MGAAGPPEGGSLHLLLLPVAASPPGPGPVWVCGVLYAVAVWTWWAETWNPPLTCGASPTGRGCGGLTMLNLDIVCFKISQFCCIARVEWNSCPHCSGTVLAPNSEHPDGVADDAVEIRHV